ncbi:hypothetical protein [Candidatus Finniella inopinata]|uniref:Uncharacterized protein n=1 Tax=Candidatus Finniella inopinata TaxID=1696036 RepID=A0A4V2DZQ2_9PROT|nr:hypothetical protein [Candidatus Finniella inopinata]RZI45847.1 hypothetical protein EQU50_05280 [Candidatus Finniella inopinata]
MTRPRQLRSSKFKAFAIAEATTRSLATALGCIPAKVNLNGDAIADGNDKVIPIASMVANNTVAVTNMQLTQAVDKLMECRFGYTALSESRKFGGATGAKLMSAAEPTAATAIDLDGFSNIQLTINAGACPNTFFTTGQSLVKIDWITPAEKLGMFLRTVFGISYTAYQGYFPDSLSLADSGAVLTTVLDNVLARGTSNTKTTFSTEGVFGRINLNPNLKNPVNYLTASFIVGNTLSDLSNRKYDVARLRALITDVFTIPAPPPPPAPDSTPSTIGDDRSSVPTGSELFGGK